MFFTFCRLILQNSLFMKITSILFTLVFFANVALAQFGITGRYHLNDAPNWVPLSQNDSSTDEKYLGNGWSAGVDYWLRFKNYRVEFLPELNYSQFEYNDQTGYINPADFSNRFFSFFLNTNFYLFDFAGDCNCPTFSKQGQFLKKGFFVQVSPGVTYLQGKVVFENPIFHDIKEYKTFESTSLAASIGAGAGLDIGISDFVTFSPMLSLRYFPNAKWESLSQNAAPVIYELASTESTIWQWSAGARLGFRFDYQSSGRRR